MSGVGAHIGNKPHRAFLAQGQAFVKLLSHCHGVLSGEVQFPPGFLL